MTPLPLYPPAPECAACRGECCRAGAGAMLPSDVPDLSADAIAALLRSGEYAVDWWEGDPRPDVPEDERVGSAYFLRPAHTNARGKARDGSWGGRCVFLQDGGCVLPWERRPTTCRALQAIGPEECRYPDGYEPKRTPAIEWLPYQDTIEAALAQVTP